MNPKKGGIEKLIINTQKKYYMICFIPVYEYSYSHTLKLNLANKDQIYRYYTDYIGQVYFCHLNIYRLPESDINKSSITSL